MDPTDFREQLKTHILTLLVATAGEATVPKVTCTVNPHIPTYMQVYSLLIYEQFTTTPLEIHKYSVCKYAIFHK